MKPLEYFLDKHGPVLGKFIFNWRSNGSKKYPWKKAAENIRQRCRNPRASKYKYYGGKGIKCRIDADFLRYAFERDKAHLMDQPSVDRIRSDRDYVPGNVRWIEFAENRAKRGGLK